MIENIRTHSYSRAVCVETARLFEQHAAKHLVEAQDRADQGAVDSALEFKPRPDLHSNGRTPGTFERKAPLTKQRAGDRNECG
jgi:hypothetical protein